MHSKQSDKLVLMVNQIAKNVAIHGEEKAVAAIARHVKMFWEPRMRQGIDAHVKAGGEGLMPTALKALQGLSTTAAPSANVTPPAGAAAPVKANAGKAPKPKKAAKA